MIKRVAAIHDLSGLGRCSLTIALPVLSVLGVQCCPVPTAVLSTQTDGYQDYSFTDLTDALPEYIAHWKKNQERFDAIYTGFLGSSRQIGLVSDFIESFRTKQTLVLVDPVMGDNGAMYDSVDQTMCEGIQELVRRADIITPNLTEAAILLQEKEVAHDEETWLEWASRLRKLGPKTVVITGIDSGDGRVCVACCDGDHAEAIYAARVARDYPGAGDLFASVLLGKLLRGTNLYESARCAAAFITECAMLTAKLNTPAREGLAFEPMLPQLIK